MRSTMESICIDLWLVVNIRVWIVDQNQVNLGHKKFRCCEDTPIWTSFEQVILVTYPFPSNDHFVDYEHTRDQKVMLTWFSTRQAIHRRFLLIFFQKNCLLGRHINFADKTFDLLCINLQQYDLFAISATICTEIISLCKLTGYMTNAKCYNPRCI